MVFGVLKFYYDFLKNYIIHQNEFDNIPVNIHNVMLYENKIS